MGGSMNQNEGGESPTVLLRRLHSWRMAFLGVAILLAGMLGGAAATLLTVSRLEPQRPRPPVHAVKMMLARLTGPLDLTDEQQRQIEPILQKHIGKLDQIQQDGQKAIAEELRLLSQDLSGVLNPDQMQLWEQLFSALPGPIRHMAGGRGPGRGRGPAPPGGWRGPPMDRRGPLRGPIGP